MLCLAVQGADPQVSVQIKCTVCTAYPAAPIDGLITKVCKRCLALGVKESKAIFAPGT